MAYVQVDHTPLDARPPGHDPREPWFPNYRDCRRHPVLSALFVLVVCRLLPVATVCGLGWLTWLYPVSPAPILFILSLGIVIAACEGD